MKDGRDGDVDAQVSSTASTHFLTNFRKSSKFKTVLRASHFLPDDPVLFRLEFRNFPDSNSKPQSSNAAATLFSGTKHFSSKLLAAK